MPAPAPLRSQFNAERAVRVAQIASNTVVSSVGTFPVGPDSNSAARRRRLHRAQRPFS
jgi:hypothetical protein